MESPLKLYMVHLGTAVQKPSSLFMLSSGRTPHFPTWVTSARLGRGRAGCGYDSARRNVIVARLVAITVDLFVESQYRGRAMVDIPGLPSQALRQKLVLTYTVPMPDQVVGWPLLVFPPGYY